MVIMITIRGCAADPCLTSSRGTCADQQPHLHHITFHQHVEAVETISSRSSVSWLRWGPDVSQQRRPSTVSLFRRRPIRPPTRRPLSLPKATVPPTMLPLRHKSEPRTIHRRLWPMSAARLQHCNPWRARLGRRLFANQHLDSSRAIASRRYVPDSLKPQPIESWLGEVGRYYSGSV